MFIKRQLAIVVMTTMGFLALSGYFVNWDTLRNFTDKHAPNFYMIIAGFAAFLGCINLVQLHLQKIAYKKENWQYSIFTLLGFIIMIVFGFFYNGSNSEMGKHLKDQESAFYWMYNYFYLPLGSTMFALLAFFVASASYRAFRIRNFEATLLLVSGIIIMVGRVPIGSVISSWFVLYLIVLSAGIYINVWKKDMKTTFVFVAVGISIVTIAGFMYGWPIDKPGIFYLPAIQEWIYYYPNVAGARSIMIGIGLGIFATSIRYILGIERSYIGE